MNNEKLGFLALADIDILAAVARGEVDLNRLAREVLANRGMNAQGVWVGFEKARDEHQAPRE
ncbi:MAG: hypothetical protein WCL27_12170 [Betaproteobacteria bacterium]